MKRTTSRRSRFRFSFRVSQLAIAAALAAACNHPPPAPPAPPPALSDSAAAALTWVQSHLSPIAIHDSTPSAEERRGVAAVASGARILGISELTEGTAEFPDVVRRTLIALSDSGFKALAVQAPMPEALEIDRYVLGEGTATNPNDLRRLLRALGSWRFDTREMASFVNALREWNHSHSDKQIHFYGFEIPTAGLAVRTVVTLPDSVIDAALRGWLTRNYACVAENESAH